MPPFHFPFFSLAKFRAVRVPQLLLSSELFAFRAVRACSELLLVGDGSPAPTLGTETKDHVAPNHLPRCDDAPFPPPLPTPSSARPKNQMAQTSVAAPRQHRNTVNVVDSLFQRRTFHDATMPPHKDNRRATINSPGNPNHKPAPRKNRRLRDSNHFCANHWSQCLAPSRPSPLRSRSPSPHEDQKKHIAWSTRTVTMNFFFKLYNCFHLAKLCETLCALCDVAPGNTDVGAVEKHPDICRAKVI